MRIGLAEQAAGPSEDPAPRSDRTAGTRANLGVAGLVEAATRREEGRLTASRAVAVTTGVHTGRSPHDTFLVRDGLTADVVWWGETNRPVAPYQFDRLHERVVRYLGDREAFVQDLIACAVPTHRVRMRVVSERARAALFARNLFIVPPPAERTAVGVPPPDVTIWHAPSLVADLVRDGTRRDTAILVDAARGRVVIAGTGYAGEIRKAVFGLLQRFLPSRGVATMHCAANAGADGATALFFGLSGTGKTTLSTDPTRTPIGDDEHGWTERGSFNFRGAAPPR